ncbi:hypothetical protein MUS1_00045 [Marinomonas ushuaiensis DSM 15871]|uniref:Uncharacterized protein n=1 Tax=Marinomonas ushuaiensis DSM 15871 TaxID=1122207 RepID=X7E7V8_9GAMM|nr:hypothetical protein [Marinomonas ushuaiensis]ETX12037.1 hypothetical protein MUS1_00045 [Marinomonas ushuaiensis DSM 15871]
MSIWPLCSYSAEDMKSEALEEGDKEQSWWHATHETVSKTIGSWSGNIDTFLSGHPSSIMSESQVEIRFGPIFGEESSSGFFDLNAQLKLPNTQDRLRLVIESNGDSLVPESELGESSQKNNVINSALSSSFSAAVRFARADMGADFDAGVRIDFPLDPFLRLRFTQGNDVNVLEWWQKQEVFAYYSDGVGARYGIGLGYKQSPSLQYSTDFGVTWLDKEGLFYVRENFFIRHAVNEKNRMSYQLSFLQSGKSDIQPDSFLYNFLYERLLYKDWLIGQIKPQFTHETENDYDGEASLTLSIAILLGPEYLH